MIRLIRFLFAPLHTLAKEVSIIRELYELDLASREQPIIRITEKPKKNDTEISYTGVVDKRPVYKRWAGDED